MSQATLEQKTNCNSNPAQVNNNGIGESNTTEIKEEIPKLNLIIDSNLNPDQTDKKDNKKPTEEENLVKILLQSNSEVKQEVLQLESYLETHKIDENPKEMEDGIKKLIEECKRLNGENKKLRELLKKVLRSDFANREKGTFLEKETPELLDVISPRLRRSSAQVSPAQKLHPRRSSVKNPDETGTPSDAVCEIHTEEAAQSRHIRNMIKNALNNHTSEMKKIVSCPISTVHKLITQIYQELQVQYKDFLVLIETPFRLKQNIVKLEIYFLVIYCI